MSHDVDAVDAHAFAMFSAGWRAAMAQAFYHPDELEGDIGLEVPGPEGMAIVEPPTAEAFYLAVRDARERHCPVAPLWREQFTVYVPPRSQVPPSPMGHFPGWMNFNDHVLRITVSAPVVPDPEGRGSDNASARDAVREPGTRPGAVPPPTPSPTVPERTE